MKGPRRTLPAALAVLALGGCAEDGASLHEATAGDAERGRLLLRQYGCGGCHRIEGVAGAVGRVGPPLLRFSRQVYVAGVLPNTEDALVRWIVDPQAIQPGSAMPDMGVSERQARDMAAYLVARD